MSTNNPFDWKNYKPQVSFADLEKARRNAYQNTWAINEKRKQGIEPSQAYGARASGVPQTYTTEMPTMLLHKKSLQRKRKKNESA